MATNSDRRCCLLLRAVTVLMVILMTGCDKAKLTMLMPGSSRTFQQKFNLKAEDYFDSDADLLLCHAIEDDNLDAMKQAIDRGADVNAKGRHGVTPLLWAFFDNKIDRFKLLLEKGADPNVQLTSNLGIPSVFVPGDSVLHLSARSRFPNHFIEVMKHGGDPNLPGRHGDRIIHELVKSGVPNARQRISIAVEKGADLNVFDKTGCTPILLATSYFSQFDLASFLLNLGADPNMTEEHDILNAIHSALAFKRDVKRGATFATPEQMNAADRFIKDLEDRGYDLEEAQEDLDRWARLAKMKPGDPSWFRNREIARLDRREKERRKQALPIVDDDAGQNEKGNP